MKTQSRKNNFNLIRLVLALLVIFGHSPELIDGNRQREWLTQLFGTVSFGELAVNGFFLLSGYLIVQSWDLHPKAWQFLKKRLLRIYPGFIIASLISALIVGPLASQSSNYFDIFDPASFLLGTAFLTIPATPAVFDGTPYAMVNGAMWTISKEFICYLLVLVAGVAGVLRRRHVFLALTLLVLLTFAWCKLKNISVVDLRLASFFLSGACYYLYRDHIAYKGPIAAAAALVTIICMCSWRLAELGMVTVGGYALLYIAEKRSELLSHFNRLPDISYGVYLYGWPIQKLLLWYYPSLSPWELFSYSATAAIIAGTISWYLVEKPALRFKSRSLAMSGDTQQKMAS